MFFLAFSLLAVRHPSKKAGAAGANGFLPRKCLIILSLCAPVLHIEKPGQIWGKVGAISPLRPPRRRPAPSWLIELARGLIPPRRFTAGEWGNSAPVVFQDTRTYAGRVWCCMVGFYKRNGRYRMEGSRRTVGSCLCCC